MAHARGGRKAPGRDYSKLLIDILPDLIGTTPLTIQQIAAATGRNKETVRTAIKKHDDKMHIAGWVHNPIGDKSAQYLWGPGEDAPKPAPLTDAQKSARYRSTERGLKIGRAATARWRRSQRGKEYQQAYHIAYSTRKKFQTGGVAAIDPLLAAIMGQRNPPQKEL